MGLRDHTRSDEGFSLLELAAVVAIMGILVAVAMASYFVSIERSRRIACINNQRLFDSALMQYQVANDGAYPPDLASVAGYLRWPGADYATCVSDGATAFTYDRGPGTVSCPNHPR